MTNNTYIFDTSVIIADPQAIKAFPNADIVLPIVLLEEVDKLKKQPNSAGKNARVFMRLLDEISDKGDISTGVMLENNAVIKVDTTDYSNNEFGNALYGDTRILACAHNTNKACGGEAILVSNDINLRVRGKVAGLMCQKYETDNVTLPDLYTGIRTMQNNKLGKQLSEEGSIIDEEKIECFPNEFIVFTDKGGNEIAKGRRKGNKIKLISKAYPWGITPRSSEQEMAIDLIMDPKIPLVTFIGAAGTGKSLITLAASLELVLNKKAYDKLMIYRPIQVVGQELGFLPGELFEKLNPYFLAMDDHFENLFNNQDGKWKQNLDMYKKKGKIQYETIAFIRGRSIQNSLIILDEAQNISKEDIKTILTRAGEGSKIILTGDIHQIDKKELDAIDNGLTYVVEKFKKSPLAGHMTFISGQRSALATEAANIL